MHYIAYTYDADYHCPGCAAEKFGVGERGFIAEDEDDVGVIAPWDEWHDPSGEFPQSLVCGSCGGVIETVEE